jgi:hypothetical protein
MGTRIKKRPRPATPLLARDGDDHWHLLPLENDVREVLKKYEDEEFEEDVLRRMADTCQLMLERIKLKEAILEDPLGAFEDEAVCKEMACKLRLIQCRKVQAIEGRLSSMEAIVELPHGQRTQPRKAEISTPSSSWLHFNFSRVQGKFEVECEEQEQEQSGGSAGSAASAEEEEEEAGAVVRLEAALQVKLVIGLSNGGARWRPLLRCVIYGVGDGPSVNICPIDGLRNASCAEDLVRECAMHQDPPDLYHVELSEEGCAALLSALEMPQWSVHDVPHFLMSFPFYEHEFDFCSIVLGLDE